MQTGSPKEDRRGCRPPALSAGLRSRTVCEALAAQLAHDFFFIPCAAAAIALSWRRHPMTAHVRAVEATGQRVGRLSIIARAADAGPVSERW